MFLDGQDKIGGNSRGLDTSDIIKRDEKGGDLSEAFHAQTCRSLQRRLLA